MEDPFQEQVIEIASDSGFYTGEADKLRRVMIMAGLMRVKYRSFRKKLVKTA